ncbi:MAG: sulfatase, partial [Planctomycetota bacterium]
LLTAALLFGWPLQSLAADESPTKRPNVVFLLADDLGWRDLGCYGSDFYETPHLDKLAAEGVRFTDAYASCPVCSPSRAAVMTGKNPARIGLTAHIGDAGPNHWRRDTPLLPAPYLDRLPHSETTLVEAFHNAGYATMHAGKWHLGHEPFWPEYQGFDINVGGWSQGGPFGGKQFFSPYGNPRLPDGPEGEHLPDRLATETARFIEAHRHEPFFIHLAWYSVHVPLVARADLEAKYNAKLAEEDEPTGEMFDARDTKERVRQDHAVYGAMVEAMDLAVGKVLKALDDAGVADNTIIVFTSDNGGLSTGDIGISADQGWPTTNMPLRAGKGWMYEGGIRVPLIVKAPGRCDAGRVSDRVVTGTDYYATLLELADLPAAHDAVDSESFVSALSKEAEAREPVFWHYPHYGNQGGRPGGAVRDGDWKLIEWYGEDERSAVVELYNVAEDVSEANNVADIETERRDQMLSMLREWRDSIDAKMPSPRVAPIAHKDGSPRAARAEADDARAR